MPLLLPLPLPLPQLRLLLLPSTATRALLLVSSVAISVGIAFGITLCICFGLRGSAIDGLHRACAHILVLRARYKNHNMTNTSTPTKKRTSGAEHCSKRNGNGGIAQSVPIECCVTAVKMVVFSSCSRDNSSKHGKRNGSNRKRCKSRQRS